MLKKWISVLLAAVMTLSLLCVAPVSAAAQTAGETPLIDSDELAVSATDSLGAMLTAEYDDYMASEDAPDAFSGYAIYDLEVEGDTAYVEVQALSQSRLYVAVFEEDTNRLCGAGEAAVTADDSVVAVSLKAIERPSSYLVRAFLVDSESNLPMCKSFECDRYTRDMQLFLAKTTEDFDEDKVLNLDDDNTDNFLVYNDDTTIIQNNNSEVNVITYADDDEKKYVIENVDESISALQPGDIFSYENGGYHIIAKVKSIEIQDGTATIYGDDIELYDAFDYVRIDTTQNSDEVSVDNSDLDEGVEYLGTFEDSQEEELAPTGYKLINEEVSAASTFSYKLKKESASGDLKLTGTAGLKFEVKAKCYYDVRLFKKDEIEFSFAIKYKLSLSAKLEMTKTKSLKLVLGYFGFSPVPGVYIDFKPALVIEGKASIQLEGALSGQFGKKFKNGKWEDDNIPAKFSAELKVEAEVFIGLSMEPHVGILGNVVSATAEAKFGVKIKAEMTASADTEQSEKKHDCKACIKGEISACLEASVKLSLADNKNLTWKADLLKWTHKFCDFYYSFDTGKFAFTTCPNLSYRQTVTVYDKSKKPVEGASTVPRPTNPVKPFSISRQARIPLL